VEDRKHGLPRVAHLQQARAKLRFLSIEPLLEDLGEIDFAGIDWII
jgi:protein gp37